MKTALAIGLAIMAPLACWAFEPQFDGEGQLMSEEITPDSQLAVPTGPFADGIVPSQGVTGTVTQRSWRVSRGFRDARTLAERLEAQLRAQGYDVAFTCETNGCGGFDFRFSLDILPPPKMFVDLSNYFFISGTQTTEQGLAGVWVIVSQTLQAGMVQIETATPTGVRIAPPDTAPTGRGGFEGVAEVTAGGQEALSEQALNDLSTQIERQGHVVLGDLFFETGASKLADREFASLSALAIYLKENQNTRIALVGHTDSQGALDVNIRLSEQRAQAVKAYLVDRLDIPGAQVEARGAGYLAPVASNRTKAGRDANRRVEAVLLNISE